MQIEYVKESELSEVINLRRLSFLAIAPQYYNSQEIENLIADVDAAQLSALIDNRSFFCIRKDGELLATSGWAENRIRHVYVARNAFNQGIGSQLVAHTLDDYFGRTHAKTLEAGVIIYAKGFYEKCGFKLIKQETAWDGSTFYLMSYARDP